MNVTDNWCPVALGLPATADKGTYIEPASSGSCFSQRQVSVGLHWADQTPGSFPEVLTQNVVGACLAQPPGELSPKATPGHSHCQVSRVWRKKYKSTAIYFVSKLLSNGSSPLGNQTSRGRKKKKKNTTLETVFVLPSGHLLSTLTFLPNSSLPLLRNGGRSRCFQPANC